MYEAIIYRYVYAGLTVSIVIIITIAIEVNFEKPKTSHLSTGVIHIFTIKALTQQTHAKI